MVMKTYFAKKKKSSGYGSTIFSNQKAIFSCHCYHVQLASLRKTAFLKHWYRILIFSYYCNRKKMTHKNLY